MSEEAKPLSPDKLIVREKILNWYRVTQELVWGKHTCEKGWQDFAPSAADGCADYHAIFSLLDLLGLSSSPRAHEEFYQDMVWAALVSRKPETNILISGLATPSMADIVLSSVNADLKSTPALNYTPQAKIDVLDICATPLLVCQRVFKPEDLTRMKFLQRDAVGFDQGKYDLIVTDAFLTRFKDGDRLKVLRNWAKMLKPDGRVVTTWRIGERQGVTGYGTADDIRIFMDNLEQQLKEWQIPIGNWGEMVHVLSLAGQYAETMHSYSGQTIEEIRAFMDQGFGDVRIEESGPVYDVTMRKYARIIAYKPKA